MATQTKRSCEFSIALGGGNFAKCDRPWAGDRRLSAKVAEFYGACEFHLIRELQDTPKTRFGIST